METLTTCAQCGASFYYSPSAHRCAGEWAAMVTPLDHSHDHETWADECVRKVMAS
jgi:hypothetical protein